MALSWREYPAVAGSVESRKPDTAARVILEDPVGGEVGPTSESRGQATNWMAGVANPPRFQAVGGGL